MNRFSYLKVAAGLAVLAVALIGSNRSTTATIARAAAPGVDLANEYRVFARYSDDLVAYDNQVAAADKRTRLVSADFDPLQRKSDDLKGRLSEVQTAARETIRKFKAANEWNDLDKVPARITDAGVKALFQESSFRQDLEDAANGLTGHANEISSPLENLRQRLTSRYAADREAQFIQAGYRAPAPFGFVSLRCSIQNIKFKIIMSSGTMTTTSQQGRDMWAACHPGQAYPF